jgi:hypothetical protein
MSAIDKHTEDCIRQAINTLLENGQCEPALAREIIRGKTEKMLDELCGKAQEHDGRFSRYLKKQSESCLWNSQGDEEHDGAYYKVGAASCFFPVAARELVKDGVEADHIALFCVQGAMEAMQCDGTSLEEAENKLMQIVLRNRLTEDLQDMKEQASRNKQKVSIS